MAEQPKRPRRRAAPKKSAESVDPTPETGPAKNGHVPDPGASAHAAAHADRHSVLGAYIRAQRQLADLSLRQLATLSNVSNAYLSQVERGLHQPSLKVLRSIGDALNISTEHMLAQAGVVTNQARTSTTSESSGTSGPTRGTVEAILADEALGEDEKQAMLALYKAFFNRR